MSAVHAWALPEAGDFNPACIIGTICKQPGVDGRPVTAVTIDNIYAVTNKVLELEPSPLQLLTLRFISSPALPCTRTFKIFMRI